VATPKNPPKTIGELVDQLEGIREELFSVQRSLEDLETLVSTKPLKPGKLRQ
jgi:hypothetical protein